MRRPKRRRVHYYVTGRSVSFYRDDKLVLSCAPSIWWSIRLAEVVNRMASHHQVELRVGIHGWQAAEL